MRVLQSLNSPKRALGPLPAQMQDIRWEESADYQLQGKLSVRKKTNAWHTLQTLCFANARFGNIIFQTGADTLPTLCFANSYLTLHLGLL